MKISTAILATVAAKKGFQIGTSLQLYQPIRSLHRSTEQEFENQLKGPWPWPKRNNTDNPNGFANKLVNPEAPSCEEFFAEREVVFENEVADDGYSGSLGISFHGNNEECIQRVEVGFKMIVYAQITLKMSRCV